jgi:hypothetical protein
MSQLLSYPIIAKRLGLDDNRTEGTATGLLIQLPHITAAGCVIVGRARSSRVVDGQKANWLQSDAEEGRGDGAAHSAFKGLGFIEISAAPGRELPMRRIRAQGHAPSGMRSPAARLRLMACPDGVKTNARRAGDNSRAGQEERDPVRSEVRGLEQGPLRDEERALLRGEDRDKEPSPAQNPERGGERGLDSDEERGLEQALRRSEKQGPERRPFRDRERAPEPSLERTEDRLLLPTPEPDLHNARHRVLLCGEASPLRGCRFRGIGSSEPRIGDLQREAAGFA